MKSHHIKNSQSDLNAVRCMYCSSTLQPDAWFSEFDVAMHYKTVTCSCGKKHHVRIDNNKQWSNLEKKIAKHSSDSKMKELKWKFSDVKGGGGHH